MRLSQIEKYHDDLKADPTWDERALCKEYPDIYGPTRTDSNGKRVRDEVRVLWFPKDREMSHEAKSICDACPVQPQCEAKVMLTETPGFRNGNQAGMTEKERRRLWRTGRKDVPVKQEAS